MRIRTVLLIGALVMATTTADATAGAPAYDLVGYRTCLAGNWGTSTAREWRVQLGVFNGATDPAVMERRFAALGIPAEAYIAAWLAGDDEPLVAVSRPYRTRAAAERAARRYRAKVGDAMVRQFVHWTH